MISCLNLPARKELSNDSVTQCMLCIFKMSMKNLIWHRLSALTLNCLLKCSQLTHAIALPWKSSTVDRYLLKNVVL